MNPETATTELSEWLSTYGVLTAQRILERFNIKLSPMDLMTAVSNERNLYYQLLRVPVKNLLNGIVLQQASDYQVYAQKLFVDYMLSGEPDKPPESPGSNTRKELETLRVDLVSKAEAFNQLEIKHQKLIAASQKQLIEIVEALRSELTSVNVEDSYGVEGKMSEYIDRCDAINGELRECRTNFYQAILSANETLGLLTDYRIDPISDAINREVLYFDSTIGDDGAK